MGLSRAGLRPEALTAASCSLSSDTLAVVDRLDPRCVRCLSCATGQPVGDVVRHSQDVLHVALSQGGGPGDRRLALIDRNRDLYCTALQVRRQTCARASGSGAGQEVDGTPSPKLYNAEIFETYFPKMGHTAFLGWLPERSLLQLLAW